VGAQISAQAIDRAFPDLNPALASEAPTSEQVLYEDGKGVYSFKESGK
jgi:hypothetical protein